MPAGPTMFELLVHDRNDVFSALAYTTYKKHEIQAMARIQLATGAPATEHDLEVFYSGASAPAMLAMYRREAQSMADAFLEESLEHRKNALERDFAATAVGQQLQRIQARLNESRGWKGWAADVSGNLAVNFVTILVIGALLFGYPGLDGIWAAVGHRSGVLAPQQAVK